MAPPFASRRGSRISKSTIPGELSIQEASGGIEVEPDSVLGEVGGVSMRKTIFAMCCAVLACTAGLNPSYPAEVSPRIRAVTAFIEIDPGNYAMRIQEAQTFLATAKEALNKAGFEGGGGRITAQPFRQYTKSM